MSSTPEESTPKPDEVPMPKAGDQLTGIVIHDEPESSYSPGTLNYPVAEYNPVNIIDRSIISHAPTVWGPAPMEPVIFGKEKSEEEPAAASTTTAKKATSSDTSSSSTSTSGSTSSN